MKKVLVTGSNGFLGKSICYILRSYGIYTLNRSNSFYNIDLSLNVPVFDLCFDIVVHAAGKAHVIPNSIVENNSFFDVNITGTKNLLSGLKNNYALPQAFVFISSVSVYGKDSGNNIGVDFPLSANEPYGLSKIQAEKLILNWCNENNVICTILRLPLLVGKNAPGNLGAMIKGIKQGYYFNIGGGKAKKSMVLCEDVAQFIPIVAPIGGIYNLTDGVHPTFAALSTAIAKNKVRNLPLFAAKILGCMGDLIGNIFPINSLKIKKITSDLTFDDSKARAMGWKPQSVLEYLKLNDL